MSENGEIYTAGNKFYTPAGTDGMDKFHLWVTLIGLRPRLTSLGIISSQISPKLPLKFSISSQRGWQAGTIKATLSPPLSFARKYNPHLANNLDIHLPGTPCLTADDFWPLLWEGPAVVVASKTCTTSNWPQDKTFPSAMQLFKKYS